MLHTMSSVAPEPTTELRVDLERLDAALTRLRRLWQRPAVRAWYRNHLDLEQVDATSYRTLRAIERASDDEVCVGDVAALLELDASTASRLVDAAVAAGYVRRTDSTVDRRRTCLLLTSEGAQRLEQLRAVRLALLHELIAAWEPTDVSALADLLDQLDRAVDSLEIDT